MKQSREKPKANESYIPTGIRRLSDLRVSKNSVFLFPGPNDAGKSTTIKLLIGLTRPTSSGGAILGHDFTIDYKRILI